MLGPYTRFRDIPLFTRDGNYRVNISWLDMHQELSKYVDELGCDLNPEFQREHVWTEEQQSRYIEYRLRNGKTGREILFNHPGWQTNFKGQMHLVDGKQRLEAVRRFLNDEIQVFGSYYSQFTDHLSRIDNDFIFVVNNLKTYPEVLQWYVDINAGGTPHTDAEIEKVRAMIAQQVPSSTPTMKM